MEKKDKALIGKKSRQVGKAFEIKVRKDLESKGFIVSKWMNNVTKEGKLIPAKAQYNPFFKRIVGEGSGFPDFIAYKMYPLEIIGIESKTNGYLDKAEKEKCEWLLIHNIFSRILIASKKKKIKAILYREFEFQSPDVVNLCSNT